MLSQEKCLLSTARYALLLVLIGCQGQSWNGVSDLRGSWYVVEHQGRRILPDGRSHRDVVPSSCKIPYLVIRSDGSFDWTGTDMRMYGAVDRLRRAGDRIDYDDGEQRGYFVVEEARYTKESSAVTLRRVMCAPKYCSAWQYFAAKILPDGNLDYRAGLTVTPSTGDAAEKASETAKLTRLEEAPSPNGSKPPS